MSAVKSNMLEWKSKAEEDFQVVLLLRDRPELADVLAFHAQQAGEKFLKMFLVHHGWRLKKTHNLSELLRYASDYDAGLLVLENDCKFLTPFAVANRYPSTFLPANEREAALAAAERIRTEILKRLPDTHA